MAVVGNQPDIVKAGDAKLLKPGGKEAHLLVKLPVAFRSESAGRIFIVLDSNFRAFFGPCPQHQRQGLFHAEPPFIVTKYNIVS